MKNQTKYVVLKEVDNSVLMSFEAFAYESLSHFHSLDIANEQIRIYMPNYFIRMLSEFWSSSPYNRQPTINDLDQFNGVKIVNGYENKIVVAFEDGVLYNIEHREMQITKTKPNGNN